MENDKYFTPDIEDMSVGCEFEMDDTWGGWKKLTLTKELLVNPMVGLGSGNERSPWYHRIRVPYLTKEQIEAEGWEEEQMYRNGTFVMILGELNKGYELTFTEGNSRIVITKVWTLFDDQVKRDNIFKGNCKDINTFRKIIKLLEI